MRTNWKFIALSLVASAGLWSCSPPPFACTEDGTANCDEDTTNGCEVTLATDPANCGACGTACSGGDNASAICTDGACGIACSDGFKNCDNTATNGCEVDVRVTVAHCGACGQACVAPANATAKCESSSCGFTCLDGFADCDQDASNGCEVDTRTDADHCNTCNNACADVAGGTGVCVDSACTFDCDDDHGDCDDDATNGCEADLRSDAAHCNACDNACADRDNGAGICVARACGVDCGEGFGNCDENDANGCEEVTTNNALHCGECGNACVAPENAVPVCDGTTCGFACVDGFGDCDDNPANGCEVVLGESTDHCNACDNACAATVNADPVCRAEGCGFSCNEGFGDCTDAAGCETNLVGNVTHCNACNVACTAGAHATPVCEATGCDYDCETGFADCDGNPANGCEVDTRNDPANCGGCSVAGSFACPSRTNAAPSCAASQCTLSCAAGFGNCDGIADNGCEEALNTVDSCGTCDTTCTATGTNRAPVCTVTGTTAACGVGCATGFGDCDAEAEGCETPVNTVTNCRACGNACTPGPHQSAACGATGCEFTCDVGFRDCDGLPANGCEIDINNDAEHCGSCTTACTGAPTQVGACNAGSCVYSCRAGQAECDSDPGTLCETAVNTPTACGGCTNACTGAQTCAPDFTCTNCGVAVDGTVNPLTGGSFTGTLVSYSSDNTKRRFGTKHSCTTSSGTGSDVAYRLVVPPGATRYYAMTMRLGTSGTTDTMISVRRTCGDNTTDVACDDDSGAGTTGSLRVGLEPGEYFVIGSAYSTSGSGPYTLDIVPFNAAPNAACSEVVPGSGASVLTTAGVTGVDLNAGVARTDTCLTSNDGPQLFYKVTVQPDQRATIRLTPAATIRAGLRLLTSCDAAFCTGTCASTTCPQTADGGSTLGTPSELNVDNRSAAAIDYFVSVSSYEMTQVGTFDLGLALTALPRAANSLCTAPVEISPASPRTNESLDGAVDVLATCGTSTTYAGRVLYYSVTVPPSNRASVTVTPTAASTLLNASVRVLDACDSTACVATANSSSSTGPAGAETVSFVNSTAANKTYIVAVSGNTLSSGVGAFDIGVSFLALATNPTCATAAAMTDGQARTNQDLALGGGALTGTGCNTITSASMLWYSFTIPANRTLVVRVQPQTAWDPVIRMLNSCSSTTCIGTSSNSISTSGAHEVNAYTNPLGADLPIVIGIANNSAGVVGTFDIETFLLPTPLGVGTCAAPHALTPSTPLMGYAQTAVTAEDLTTAELPGCGSTSSYNLHYATVEIPPNSSANVILAPLHGQTGFSTWTASLKAIDSCTAPSTCYGAFNSGTTGHTAELTLLNSTAAPVTRLIAAGASLTSTSTRPFRLSVSFTPRYTVSAIAANCATMDDATPLAYSGTSDDTTTATRAVPFPFSFFSTEPGYYAVSSNGNLQFLSALSSTGNTTATNPASPYAVSPNNYVAPFWDDLDYDAATQASSPLLEKVVGAEGSRIWVVQWTRMAFYNSSAPPPGDMTFQVKFFEADDAIEFHYCALPDTVRARGAEATIGIENVAGWEAASLTYNVALQSLPTGFRFHRRSVP